MIEKPENRLLYEVHVARGRTLRYLAWILPDGLVVSMRHVVSNCKYGLTSTLYRPDAINEAFNARSLLFLFVPLPTAQYEHTAILVQSTNALPISLRSREDILLL